MRVLTTTPSLLSPQVARRFRDWLRALAGAFPIGTPKAHLFGARSHGNELLPWYNASQLSWLVDASGKRLVTDVFKLEELEERWPQLQGAVCGLASTPYGDPAATSRRNPSKHRHYSYYYDEETRKIVEAYAAADFAAFNYTFERSETESGAP
jgi:hypothetical protein